MTFATNAALFRDEMFVLHQELATIVWAVSSATQARFLTEVPRMSPNATEFQALIDRLLSAADELGFVAVEISAGNLHRKIGGYPGANHRMPMCCATMKKSMKEQDSIVSAPAKGVGASLTVRFKLPR